MSNSNQIALEYYNKGVACYQKRDLDGAISNWSEAIRHQPDYISAIQNLGIAYLEKGNPDAALKSLNQAIRFQPDWPSLYYSRALVYVGKNDFAQAIADYTQALALDPKHPNAHCNRGILYFKLGEIEKARVDLTTALQINPNDGIAREHIQKLNQLPDAEVIVSDALREIQQGNLEKAWLMLQVAYDYGGKNNGKVHIGFGAIYEQQEAFAKAFAAFDYAVSCDSSPQSYNNRGRMSLVVGDFEAAMSDFKQTVRLQPDNARGYFNIGGVYLQLNQPQKAVACFNEAMKLGYTPAKQAMLNAQKQIGKVIRPDAQKNLFNVTSPDKKDFIQSILLLTKFAYMNCGPHQWLSLVNKSSFFGLHTQQNTQTHTFWATAVEELNEFRKDGSHGNRMGATLEFFAPSNFMIRITRPSQETYELSLYMKKKLDGVSVDSYIKQAEHTWLLSQVMLASKLAVLIQDGIIKKHDRTLIYIDSAKRA